jgi:hypothetical protein
MHNNTLAQSKRFSSFISRPNAHTSIVHSLAWDAWHDIAVWCILCTACLIEEDPFRKKPGRGVPCMMHHPSVHDTSCMVVSWLVFCTHKDMNGLSLAFSTLSRWIVFDMRSTPASLNCTVIGSRKYLRNQRRTFVPSIRICTSACNYIHVGIEPRTVLEQELYGDQNSYTLQAVGQRFSTQFAYCYVFRILSEFTSLRDEPFIKS